ncbi:MAG: PAS domain S-box protein [Elusimicrobia bacterium]|nr:PAS domain S-box protein [Elusimicrobiota bacterium]
MELTAETCALVFAALEQTSDTIFITDAEGKIVYANPYFEKLTGYKISEAIGKNANILKSGGHTKEFYAQMWNTIKNGKSWSGRFMNKRKDGAPYTEKVRISPVRDAKGAITHFISVRHDITRELALESQLTQGQKMEALGLLAGQLSHDFNNLLTIIIGSMELVKEDLKEGATGMKLAEDILKTSKESANLIKQLLIFARCQDAAPSVVNPVRDTGCFAPKTGGIKPPAEAFSNGVNLNGAIKEAEILLDRLPGRNIKVEFELAPDLYQVIMDPEQFKQALMNLAINARDAMPQGGTIKISAFNFSAAPGGAPPLAPGQYAAVEVSDSGAGIPPEIMDHIFEPFFTTKPRCKGAGLGLALVYGIIKQHKGEILARSNPGKGAVFTIYLPKV